MAEESNSTLKRLRWGEAQQGGGETEPEQERELELEQLQQEGREEQKGRRGTED